MIWVAGVVVALFFSAGLYGAFKLGKEIGQRESYRKVGTRNSDKLPSFPSHSRHGV